MAIEFMMPQLGLTMTEGTISKWFKSVGDAIAVGELLVEVETEKITNQLESTVAGTVLDILVPEGSAVPVQTAIALIGKPGEQASRTVESTVAAPADIIDVTDKAPGVALQLSSAVGKRVMASPFARKLAKEQGIDLTIVTGTGPGGRVVERDVVGFIKRTTVKATPLAARIADDFGLDLHAIKKESRIMKDDVIALLSKRESSVTEFSTSVVSVTGMRKVIAERMSVSWQTVPHVNMTAEVDMTAASDVKKSLGIAAGRKISFTEIIIRCAAHALGEFKIVNASMITDTIQLHESINIGVAVALENGLIVPVIKNADKKSIIAVGKEIGELSLKARQGLLSRDEISGGTFTVTNLGMFGIDHFTPIINQPESAILGVCRVVEKAVVSEGSIVIRPMMNLCLSFDHRLIDGAVGARFLSRIRQLLEQPLLLL
ncbi:MAG: dihydrolipoamide acetyltransferase family protein [Desulfuromonadales bacterium]